MPEHKYSGMSVASFVLGLCGLIPYFFGIPNVLAIVFGFIALNQIKKNKNLRGRALAIWGIILGFAFLILVLIGIIWVIVNNIMQSGVQ